MRNLYILNSRIRAEIFHKTAHKMSEENNKISVRHQNLKDFFLLENFIDFEVFDEKKLCQSHKKIFNYFLSKKLIVKKYFLCRIKVKCNYAYSDNRLIFSETIFNNRTRPYQ